MEELAEPISALDITGLLVEPIYPNSSDPPPISPLPGSEEEQAAGAMEVTGEEDEEEKPSAAGAEVAPESASQATADLNADQEPLDTSRMVGLTLISRSGCRPAISTIRPWIHPCPTGVPPSNAHQGTPCSQGTSQRCLLTQHSLQSQ